MIDKTTKSVTLFSLLVFSLFYMSGCTPKVNHPTIDKKQYLNGYIILDNGERADNAAICLYKSNYNALKQKGTFPSGAYASTVSDSTGKFKFPLPNKTDLVLIANSGNQWTMHPLHISPSDTISDTLKKAGQIIFQIAFLKNHDPRSISISIPGFPFASQCNEKGIATCNFIPAGKVKVSIGDNSRKYRDTTIILDVNSGRNDTTSVRLNYKGLLPTTNLNATFDTTTGVAHVTWSDTNQNVEYLVYKKLDTQKAFKSSNSKTVQKEFTDTLFVNNPRKSAFASTDTLTHSSSYYIIPVSKADKKGFAIDTIILPVVSPKWIATESAIKVFQTKNDTVSINDTVMCVATIHNRSRNLLSALWTTETNSSLNPLNQKKSCSDTFTVSFKDPGIKTVTLKTTDNSNSTHFDSCRLVVIVDKPVVKANSEKSTGLNDPIHLDASVSKKFGRVVNYEWDLGCTNKPITLTHPDTIISAPSRPTEKFRCALKVTDDDGDNAFDTITIAVMSRPPKAKAQGDSLVGLFEPIHLNGSGSDNGKIVKYEWDAGCTGKFTITNDNSALISPLRMPNNSLRSVLRVTDDDGEQGYDTLKTKVKLLWARNSSIEVTERNGNSFVEFKGSMWIIGGGRSDVWSSPDGASWQKLIDSASFGQRYGHTSVTFDNKLWIIGGKLTSGEYPGDVWSSPDGVSWSKVSDQPFLKRHYHTSVVFDNKIWVIGGLGENGDDPCFNDIWCSSDGINWSMVGQPGTFSARYGQGTVVYNNKIWVIGGFYDGINGSNLLRDVWSSSDGHSWEKVTDVAGFSKDRYHSYLVFDNNLWAIGGYGKNQSGFSDVWCSTDGVVWKQLSEDEHSAGKYFNSSLVYKNRVWVLPGDAREIWSVR